MIWKKINHTKILILIILFSAFLHLFRLGYPNAYVFDEVYHAFTAKEYLKASKAAWDPFATPPKGVAYEWTHPPLAKELMAISMMLVNSTDAWAWRLPGALLGILTVYLIYKVAKELFKKESIALISAFLFSIEGLNFVQSRTGMNDVYLVSFVLASLLFFLRKRFVISAFFLGLALASKWTGIYFIGLIVFLLLLNFYLRKITLKEFAKNLLIYILILPVVYFLTYLPYFLLGYDLNQFIELHRQMLYYHTHLKATHDYASPWWSWPLNLYPVWFFVEYHKNGLLSNIFTSGNPLLFWIGSGAILVTIWDAIKLKSLSLFIIIMGFFVFWLPWAFSPRIMFLYHFSPSASFLTLALGYQLGYLFEEKKKSSRLITFSILIMILLSFIFVYPVLSGIPITKELLMLFFKTSATKNPFG